MKHIPILHQRTPAAMARRVRTAPRTRSAQAGVSLVEALVAFLVTAFGMLSVAGMQASLSRNSDTAKQRSEAVRLAQQKMEQLRSFDAITGGNYSYGVDVVSDATEAGIAPAASNTTFTRTWTVTKDDGATATTANDSRKWIHVTVDWADRQGSTQPTPVVLHSVIARNDPVMLKGLVAGQVRPAVRYPKNRSLNIPYPAVKTSDPTRSAFIPPPGNVTFVFDNLTGKIVQSCTGVTNLTEGINLSSYSCTARNAYLLSGYVRFYLGSNPSANDLINPNGATLDLSSSGPLTIDATATGNGPSAYSCYAQRQKVMSAGNVSPSAIASISRTGNVVRVTTSGNHGLTVGVLVSIESVSDFLFNGSFEILTVGPANNELTYAQVGPTASSAVTASSMIKLIQQITVAEGAPVPSGYTGQPDSTFVAYACVVTPVDDDNNASTPEAWWGQVNLVPSGWAFGTTSTTYKVCRYTGDYNGSTTATNSEHPQYYRRVTNALDSQNFAVIRGNENCPGDGLVSYTGSADDLFNSNTVPHQPTAALSYQCTSSSSCSGSNKTIFEPASATTPILME